MPPKKDAPKKDAVAEIGFIIIVIIFLWVLWSMIISYYFGTATHLWAMIVSWLGRFIWPIVKVLAVIISLLCIAGIVHILRKFIALNKEEDLKYGSNAVHLKDLNVKPKGNERWEHAIAHLNSANAGDWRLAIIEADVMLDEALRALGYHGDSIGDMLKGIDKSSMLTLDAAWDAHKVRNQIVHSGSDYYLTEREAKRVMNLYESVFREFKII